MFIGKTFRKFVIEGLISTFELYIIAKRWKVLSKFA